MSVSTGSLRLEEVVEATKELGGEVDWRDIRDRVRDKRGGSFAPYQDWNNFNKTMFQLVQQRCPTYKKFTGPIRFEKVGKGTRFRLFRAVGRKAQSGGTHASRRNPKTYENVLSRAAEFESSAAIKIAQVMTSPRIRGCPNLRPVLT